NGSETMCDINFFGAGVFNNLQEPVPVGMITDGESGISTSPSSCPSYLHPARTIGRNTIGYLAYQIGVSKWRRQDCNSFIQFFCLCPKVCNFIFRKHYTCLLICLIKFADAVMYINRGCILQRFHYALG